MRVRQQRAALLPLLFSISKSPLFFDYPDGLAATPPEEGNFLINTPILFFINESFNF